jgi:hypothetical protein
MDEKQNYTLIMLDSPFYELYLVFLTNARKYGWNRKATQPKPPSPSPKQRMLMESTIKKRRSFLTDTNNNPNG